MDLLLLTADPNLDSVLPSRRARAQRPGGTHRGVVADGGRQRGRRDHSTPAPILPPPRTVPPTRQHRVGDARRRGPHRGRSGGGQRGLGIDEFLLPATGPAEIDARLRLLMVRTRGLSTDEAAGKVTLGELVIDEGTYTARLRGKPLDLTYKEFELLISGAERGPGVHPRATAARGVGRLSAAPAPSTSTFGVFAPNSAASMNR